MPLITAGLVLVQAFWTGVSGADQVSVCTPSTGTSAIQACTVCYTPGHKYFPRKFLVD